MVVTIFQSSKYIETGLGEEKNKSMDVQHIWETQYVLLQSWLMSDDENLHPAAGEVVNLVDWNAYMQYSLNLENSRCSECYNYSSITHHNYGQW
jgi:hypothetical protein